jgi:hypothetical protein
MVLKMIQVMKIRGKKRGDERLTRKEARNRLEVETNNPYVANLIEMRNLIDQSQLGSFAGFFDITYPLLSLNSVCEVDRNITLFVTQASPYKMSICNVDDWLFFKSLHLGRAFNIKGLSYAYVNQTTRYPS